MGVACPSQGGHGFTTYLSLDCSSEEEEEEEEEEGGGGGGGGGDDDDDDDDDDDEDLDGDVPLDGRIPDLKLQEKLKSQGLSRALGSGRYPEFLGIEGPRSQTNPQDCSPLDYLQDLWPESLMDVICEETNRYARDRHLSNWFDTTVDELWTFLGLNMYMGIKREPAINDYWRCNSLGEIVVQKCMSRSRFWSLRRNVHVVDNAAVSPGDNSVGRKIKPILDVLGRTFCAAYNPGQELSVDEAMVKYKGHVKGKVRMPKKPIKNGFKIWCCACSCCGFLCTFRVYSGKPTDPLTGKKVAQKGLVKDVVKDLLAPFENDNRVVYMDNFFSSGPLVSELAKVKIYVAGTIKKDALGFPDALKSVNLDKGAFVAQRVGDICYYVFNDRKVVRFVSNVFPESMTPKVARIQCDGVFGYQSVPPLLPAYNKFMGAVDRVSQVKKNYGVDRRGKRYWLRLFFQFLDYAVDNAHILYRHNCRRVDMKPMSLKEFRLKLAYLLMKKCPSKCTRRMVPKSDVVGCSLSRVLDIGLTRGRCHHYKITNQNPVRHTFFGCSNCQVRLCKIPCFAQYHEK